jgi:hypothetical protein
MQLAIPRPNLVLRKQISKVDIVYSSATRTETIGGVFLNPTFG